MIKVTIDPLKKKMIVDNDTLIPMQEHMKWCRDNCKHAWYNECNNYSYIMFADVGEAYQFALRYHTFESEQDKMMFLLKN